MVFTLNKKASFAGQVARLARDHGNDGNSEKSAHQRIDHEHCSQRFDTFSLMQKKVRSGIFHLKVLSFVIIDDHTFIECNDSLVNRHENIIDGIQLMHCGFKHSALTAWTRVLHWMILWLI